MTLARLNVCWRGIRHRCRKHPRYAGRGISMCEEWRNDFRAFAAWALLNGYHDHLTIDRIDNNAGYSPDNCRWATMLVQLNNTSRNRVYKFRDEFYTLPVIARMAGVNFQTLRARVRGYHIPYGATIPAELLVVGRVKRRPNGTPWQRNLSLKKAA